MAIRKHRRDAMDMLADAKKEGDISEDEQDRAKKRVEEIIQGQVKRVDAIVAERESAIMEV